ncbi:MAG: DnaD domain protein [Dehalococcoidia bacterium]|nr:DnaD domain protein [Dehalococcoidia bacterium]
MTSMGERQRGGESRPASSGASVPFAGFVAGAAATTLPVQLFTELLPTIADPVELRVTLYALYAVQRRRGRLRAVRESELAAEAPLRAGLELAGGLEALRFGLAAARARGVLLACSLEDGDTLYFINSDVGRRSLAAVQSGALDVPVASAGLGRASDVEPSTSPARVYEAEIGSLTPSIAEALASACERFPEDWIIEALRIAALRGARNWNYAAAVLRGWESEGRSRTSAGVASTSDGDGDRHGRPQGTAGGTAEADGARSGPAGDPYARVVRRGWPLDGARDRP